VDEILLRPVTEADVPRLLEIESAWATTPHWTADHFRREIGNERGVGLGAEQGGRLVGYAFVWVVAGEAQVANIAVDPVCARRGIGRLLLRRLIEAAAEKGARVLTLEVSESNAAAKALYGSEGLRVVGRRPKFYNGLEDALLMTLPLLCAHGDDKVIG